MTSIEDYFDAWSDVYDAELDTRESEDVDFYRRQAERADGPVLEIGCGTGRIYLELLEAGVDAYGIDVSSEMLERLRARAEQRGLEPAVERADVADFDADREYALVIAPADVLLYNLTIESQVAALENVRSVLAPDGEFVFSYFTPDFETICEEYGTETTRELTFDDERYTVATRLCFVDEVERIVSAERVLRDEDREAVLEAEALFKLLPKREMELLLQRSGFRDYEVYGGFGREDLTAASYRMVWFARPD